VKKPAFPHEPASRGEHEPSSLAELLVFIALLIPTLLVLAAAVVSLAFTDAPIAHPSAAQTTAACEPCREPAPESREPER
jgi:hypothetical protein